MIVQTNLALVWEIYLERYVRSPHLHREFPSGTLFMDQLHSPTPGLEIATYHQDCGLESADIGSFPPRRGS